MNRELKLQIQAYLDGELSDFEIRKEESTLADDPEASALCTELRATRELLRANEIERKMPESRDFYWSKIARQIEASEAVAVEQAQPAWLPWLRWLIPAAGCALLLAWLVVSERFGSRPSPTLAQLATGVHEIETPVDGSSVITFRSESEGIEVVWLNTR